MFVVSQKAKDNPLASDGCGGLTGFFLRPPAIFAVSQVRDGGAYLLSVALCISLDYMAVICFLASVDLRSIW